MTRRLYLLCGVPGSGKTWVANQLTDHFLYIAHDDYIGRIEGGRKIPARDVVQAAVDYHDAQPNGRVFLLDCPFGERILKEKLEAQGFDVRPVFIVELPAVIAERYHKREGKPISKNNLTRAVSIKERAEEWKAPFGTSSEILAFLRAAA